jgi:hypothetical protein
MLFKKLGYNIGKTAAFALTKYQLPREIWNKVRHTLDLSELPNVIKKDFIDNPGSPGWGMSFDDIVKLPAAHEAAETSQPVVSDEMRQYITERLKQIKAQQLKQDANDIINYAVPMYEERLAREEALQKKIALGLLGLGLATPTAAYLYKKYKKPRHPVYLR